MSGEKITINKILSTIIIIGTIFGMVFGATTYFATASDVKKIEERLDQKIKSDKIFNLQSRIWDIESKFRNRVTMEVDASKMPKSLYKEYIKMKSDLDDLKGK